ncbi:LysR family transcriptional regulator [Blastococcus haudaquaticus]|uniref:Transcriptional regulator, LysR family n=1 Tax=Blastococcus haudaquaticus TaxID=1938745 RepID=A0A286GRA0_9ACTN|nr:LysR substrate-binding domain-containing protein [Blastococcus haudaquaticus]SOD98050.1 transcriptional regulator, LysR family [Blastococcus haudaquaticus]
MDLARLDLNLLVALDALLQQRSVSKAAVQTGVGQPAMSSSLARLRRHFGDDLLARVGNEYHLTPLALELRERARMARVGLERVFGAHDEFDPASSDREFTLQVSDYGEAVLGSPVADLLADAAPRARLRHVANTARPLDSSDPTLLGTDLVVMPHGFVTDLRHDDLYRDEWVCLVSTANTAVGDALTLDQLRALPWVVTFHSSAGTTQGMAALRLIGVEPDVRVVTEHFLGLPGHVAGSERIALMQRRLVDTLPPRDDVRVLPCPFPAGVLTVAMWWHPVHDDDPAHAWFRALVRRASRTLKPLP